MGTPFSYSTTYVLDKPHFNECYNQSVMVELSMAAYLKAVLLLFLGLYILNYTEASPYAGWFVVILGIIEGLSVKYRKAWWLARQMFSNAADGEVTLTIDDKAISTKSVYVNGIILWADVAKIERTSLGWLVLHAAGKNYISAQCLSAEAQEFMVKRRTALADSVERSC